MPKIAYIKGSPVFVDEQTWNKIKIFQTTPVPQTDVHANQVNFKSIFQFDCDIGTSLYDRYMAFAPIIGEKPLDEDLIWHLWEEPNDIMKGIL